jgi:uncharacterized protein YndB with AHSA1/START domain
MPLYLRSAQNPDIFTDYVLTRSEVTILRVVTIAAKLEKVFRYRPSISQAARLAEYFGQTMWHTIERWSKVKSRSMEEAHLD